MTPQQPTPQRDSKHKHPFSILAYLIALFSVAFALLLLSYFMQERRNSQEVISGLQENASAMQTVTAVLERNQELERENDQLKEDLADLADAQHQADQAELTILALDWLWRIEREYFQRHYTTARNLIQAFEETELVSSLPTQSPSDPDYRSPLAQYQAIYKALF